MRSKAPFFLDLAFFPCETLSGPRARTRLELDKV